MEGIAVIPSLLPVFSRINLSFEKGEGAYLFGSDGRRYLDFASGIAVTALGHAHPHLVAALKAAAEKPWHLSNLYEIPEQKQLADRLVAHSFADTAFFCNSGAEALECGIKMVRKYHAARGQAQKYRMISIQGAFHGRTLATIAAGGQEKYLAGFGPKVDGFDQVAFGNLNELRAAITPETAGIMIEPVQGEGGVRANSADYLRALRQVADEFGLLLLFDEVQCGMGRTGTLFAYEQADVAPDVMALAKGLGGGFPVGACLASERAASGMTAGVHGTTFGGNPLAMSVANAVLDVMLAPGFLDHVTAISEKLRHGLARIVAANPAVYDEVRGQGLLSGLRCVVPNGEVQTRLREHGLLTVAAGDNVVRLLPPLTIGDQEVTEALAAIEAVASAWVAQA
ncbi:aspartate aminotransferase family protein [Elstera cyanobacteriorum]|uniref:aspartate aminotransferase family protein n=1 Tax=Elstera cyanobacteriorum TaxID=2022747 RepID=UPI002356B42C|nr:aspartate aminotransferase family protein [Elstera cyanobacteriorum]MCK6441650.1 aspartate aminotransferase family protein [Elstera cyanobacteriorum]